MIRTQRTPRDGKSCASRASQSGPRMAQFAPPPGEGGANGADQSTKGLQPCTEMARPFPEPTNGKLRRASAAVHCHVTGEVPADGGLSMRDARKPIAFQPCRPRDGRDGARKAGLETPQTRCVKL